MKKKATLASLLAAFVLSIASVNADVITVEDFESKAIGDVLPVHAYGADKATALVAADPKDATNKVGHITATDWNSRFKFTITLPAGTYDKITFDLLRNKDDDNYKKLEIVLDGTQIYEDADYTEQGTVDAWASKTYTGLAIAGGKQVTLEIGINSNKADYCIDNVKIYSEGSTTPATGIVFNSDFENGTIAPWESWGNSSTGVISAQGEGYDGSNYSFVLTNPTAAENYSAQAGYGFEPLTEGHQYKAELWAKSSVAAGSIQIQVQNADHAGQYSGDKAIGTEWVKLEWTFTATSADRNKLTLDFGKVAATYYVDNISLTDLDFNDTPPGGDDNVFVVEDFDSKTIGDVLPVHAYNAADATAVVAADPKDATNKVGHITATNWNSRFKFTITLPAGTFDKLTFDLLRNEGDDNYKKLEILLDDTRIYEDADYTEQGAIGTWAPKKYTDLAIAGGKQVTLEIGINSNAANYCIDNVKLHASNPVSVDETDNVAPIVYSIPGAIVAEGIDKQAVSIYTPSGLLIFNDRADGRLEIGVLPGIYIVRIGEKAVKTTVN